MSITKDQVRVYRMLKSNTVQLTLYGCGVFIFIFIASLYNYSLQAWEKLPNFTPLQTAIDSLPKGKDLERLKKKDIALKLSNIEKALQDFPAREVSLSADKQTLQYLINIFIGAAIYFLVLGIPVFLVFFMVYKGGIVGFLHIFTRRQLLTDSQIKAWVFPLFLLVSSLVSLVFTALFAYIPIEIKQRWFLLLVSTNRYINFVTIEFLCLLTAGAAFTKTSIEKNRELERAKRLTEIRRRKSVEETLGMIRARIRPHFLFNALQNLKILASEKSDELPHLMNQLSRLLRYTFTEADNSQVTISKEIEFVTSYLALEKLNISRDTHFSFVTHVSPETMNKKIAPMLLLVIVENCFKHYNKSSHEAKTIDITIETTDEWLTLDTLNTFDLGLKNEHDETQRTGFGLKWIEEHLRLLYPNQYLINYGHQTDNLFFVNLKIPLQ